MVGGAAVGAGGTSSGEVSLYNVSLYMHDLQQYWLGHVKSSVAEHPGHFRMNLSLDASALGTYSRLLDFSV